MGRSIEGNIDGEGRCLARVPGAAAWGSRNSIVGSRTTFSCRGVNMIDHKQRQFGIEDGVLHWIGSAWGAQSQLARMVEVEIFTGCCIGNVIFIARILGRRMPTRGARGHCSVLFRRNLLEPQK